MTNTIEPQDLKILASQRTKTDADDAGGKNSGREVVDGESNNLFLDISEVNRTTGQTSVQKCYLAVQTDNDAVLQGATAFVSRNPQDPNVSAVLFSTESWDDTTLEAKNRISNYLAKGGEVAGVLMNTQWKDMKFIQVMMYPEENPSSIGATLVLTSNGGRANKYEQYVRVTEVSTRQAFFTTQQGNRIEYKIATYMLNDSLEIDFEGLSVQQWYENQKPVSIVSDTIVADTGKYYSSVNLKSSAAVGQYTVDADSIYTQLVPSAQTETPIINIDAAGNTIGLVKAANQISKQHNIVVNSTQALYIGSTILPGSVSFNLFGLAVTDVGGELKNSQGAYIGTIDYQNGHIQWNANAGTGNASITINFTPAGRVVAPIESTMIQIQPENNGLNWVQNLLPLPTRGSVQVSYVAQGNVYTLQDNGSGQLRGSDSAFGVGTIDYENGTVSFTVGALPDVYSAILITWATTVATIQRADISITKAYIDLNLGDSIDKNTNLVISWLLNSTQKSATVTNGVASGDATGLVDYAGGLVRLMPNQLPNRSTIFAVSGRIEKGARLSGAMSAAPLNGSLRLLLDTTNTPITPNTLTLRVPIAFTDHNLKQHTGEIDLFDRGGQLVTLAGTAQGSVNHTTGEVNVTPRKSFSFVERIEKTTPYYGFNNTNVAALEQGYKGLQISYSNVKHDGILSLSGVNGAVSVAFSYRNSSEIETVSKSFTVDKLKLDLSDGYPESILSESVRFRLGGSTYVDRAGVLQRDIEQTTGIGVISGQIHYGTGAVELSAWTVADANTSSVESLVVRLSNTDSNNVSFRSPVLPLRPQSLSLVAITTDGRTLNINPDLNGDINTAECQGFFNFEQGYGRFEFREKIRITEANRQEIMSQSWYVADAEYTESGNTFIHKPVRILPESLRYSAVSYSYLPIDSDVLGLSATRLPQDGRVPIFRKGEMAIVSASKQYTLPSHIAGQSYQFDDVRIAWCELRDANGVKIDPVLYSVDYDYGKVTLGGDFVLGNLQAPVIADYRYQDMRLIKEVKINGQLTFTRHLSHNYSAENTIVGSVLYVGDMQARYTNKFMQESWSNVWADVPSGLPISANYNDTLYPIEVTNRGAEQDQWALVFTSATNFRIIGKMSGQVGTGVITDDCFPINPATNAPFFRIRKQGWGGGYQSGYTLRFKTIAATYPVQVIRTVKASDPAQISDSFQIMFRGDRDRVI